MSFQRILSALVMASAFLGFTAASHAEVAAPDAMIKEVSDDVMATVKSDKEIQAGDVQRIRTLVDSKVMPHVDFRRMTASAVGRFWRTATPDQQQRLQDEFKTLLIRTYAGALTQVKPQTTLQLKPFRGSATDNDVVVRSEIRGSGEPIELDYRLEKAGDGWKIYDVNVAGVWLVDQYRTSFAQEAGANGVNGLINKLVDMNQKAAAQNSAKG
jgi:phospholipid transport system substrate-binding protein